MRLLLSLLILVLTACSEYEPKLEVDVQVNRNKETGVWRVSYEVNPAFQSLNFARQRYQLRGKHWRSLTPGVRIENVGSNERVVADKLITKFEIEFDDRPPAIANDYPIVSYYSDNSAVLYTGHLLLKVPDCDGCRSQHEFNYSAAGEEKVITEENNHEQGDFVYFGSGEITEYDTFKAVSDHGLPDWIKRQIERSFPTFLLHYQTRLGFQLGKKPLVFVAYDKALRTREEGYLGGVVGSHMQLVLVGKGWEEADGKRYEKFAHLIAHEVFHLWNGALFLAPDQIGGSWLHEGGADAVADYALFELGYYNNDRYHEIQTEHLNKCMLGIARRGLPSSDEKGFYRNFYDCGAVMNHIVGRKFASEQTTLFDLWKSIFEGSRESFYSHGRFFDSASSLVNDPAVLETLSKLTSGTTGEPGEFFRTSFDRLGIGHSMAPYGFPDWYQDMAAEHVVELLAERDCGATVPVEITDAGIFVQGAESCTTLKSSHELQNVSGYTLPTSGAEAYDYLNSVCATNPVATVYDLQGQSFVTSCHEFPQRPSFIVW